MQSCSTLYACMKTVVICMHTKAGWSRAPLWPLCAALQASQGCKGRVPRDVGLHSTSRRCVCGAYNHDVQAVDQFSKSNLEHVRNRTGFFMSIIRRVKDEAAGNFRDYRGGGGADRYARGGGGRGDRYGGYGGYGGGRDMRGPGDRYDRGGGDRYGDRGYGDRGYDRGGRYERPRY